MSNQQIPPLRGLGVELTNEIVDKYRWDPFWDAPLTSPARWTRRRSAAGRRRRRSAGLPRKRDEITRAAAAWRVTSCSVKTDGARAMSSFPGVTLGVFTGACSTRSSRARI